jgi:nicotinamide mononucleotide transporter
LQLYTSEILAVIFAVLYIFAAAREQPISWVWAIISSLFWAYASFFIFKLYVDVFLQFFFIVTSVIGLYFWRYGGAQKSQLPVSRMNILQHLYVLIIGTVLSIIFGYFFATHTQAASTYLDSMTTVFSIINTYLLVRKKIENWLYWMVIDLLMAYLFFIRGGYFFSGLYLFYVFLSIDGYQRWKKKLVAKAMY